MMNRRQLMGTGAAALFASIPKAHAATYDLLIKGGRVIDPSVGLDAIRDIAIAGGKIVAVEGDIAGDASQTIDARGKIVAPGLTTTTPLCGCAGGCASTSTPMPAVARKGLP